MFISFLHDAVFPGIAFQNPTNPDIKRTSNSYKAHMDMSVSTKRHVRCRTSPDHSEKIRVINNHKFKYLWVHGGYKNIWSRFVHMSTRQELFRPINEEMGLVTLHFSQKGKYRVWHDAVANCSRLLLKSITLPRKPDFLSATLHSTRPQVMKTSRWGQNINEYRQRQKR